MEARSVCHCQGRQKRQSDPCKKNRGADATHAPAPPENLTPRIQRLWPQQDPDEKLYVKSVDRHVSIHVGGAELIGTDE